MYEYLKEFLAGDGGFLLFLLAVLLVAPWLIRYWAWVL